MHRFTPLVLLAAGLTVPAAVPAQTCTIANWSATSGAQGLSTGTPAEDHRRFEGACGLKVTLGSSPRYVEDNSPEKEAAYFARFYFFSKDLALAGDEWVDLFIAYQGGRSPTEVLALRLEQGADGRQIVLRARDGSRVAESDPVPLLEGWNGVEVTWKQATGPANGSAELVLNGNTRAELSGLDNRSSTIDLARLGAVAVRNASGSLDFDAFVSHRSTPVGPLVKGDATADEAVDAADLVAVVNELNERSFAKGQPDCNGDGTVDSGDLDCLARRIVSQ